MLASLANYSAVLGIVEELIISSLEGQAVLVEILLAIVKSVEHYCKFHSHTMRRPCHLIKEVLEVISFVVCADNALSEGYLHLANNETFGWIGENKIYQKIHRGLV